MVADSPETSVNGLGLSSLHEGAGINYFFLGSGSQTLMWDDESGAVSVKLGEITQSISISNTILQLSVFEPSRVTVADGVVSVDGNDSFYACKNISDPYNYSEKSYAVLDKAADGCFAMKIKVKTGATPSSTDASSTDASSTAAPTISTISGNGASLKSAGSIAGAAAIIAALL